MHSLKSLSMVILMQNDLKKAIDFYKNLGCAFVFEVPDKWAELYLDGIKIGLCATSNHQQCINRTGLVFEVCDLKAFHETYKEQFEFVNELLFKTHGVMASVKDPGGNIIDLYQPTPEKVQELINTMKSRPEGSINESQAIPSKKCCKSQKCC